MSPPRWGLLKDRSVSPLRLKESESVSLSVVSDALRPQDYSLPDSSVHGVLQGRVLEWVAMPSSGDLPDPGVEHGPPTLQADSLSSESPGLCPHSH